MKTTVRMLPLILLLAVSCFHAPVQPEKVQPSARPARKVPTVTADDVSQENAHPQAEALRREMKQAQHDRPPDASAAEAEKPSR